MRNLDDARLRRLAEKGGVIHVNSVGSFIRNTNVSNEYRMALRALTERYYGVVPGSREADEFITRKLALHERFDIQPATFEDYMRHVLHIIRVAGPAHVGFGADWDGGGGVVGLEDVSMLPKITARLLQEGYTAEQVEAMWGGNLLRVMDEAQRVARELAAAAAVAAP
jgi:membrane dipeptidase